MADQNFDAPSSLLVQVLENPVASYDADFPGD
jgi:hypothetical protein